MLAKIFITLKNGVLDPQGKAIEHSLGNLGIDGIKEVRQGKLIEVKLDPMPLETANEKVKAMCEKLLANMVVENFQFTIEQ